MILVQGIVCLSKLVLYSKRRSKHPEEGFLNLKLMLTSIPPTPKFLVNSFNHHPSDWQKQKDPSSYYILELEVLPWVNPFALFAS